MNIIYKIILLSFLVVSLSFISCSNSSEPEQINSHNKILFTSKRSGKEQLYLMNPDGTNIKQITSGQYWHNNGRWSPDAQKIVCNTEERTTTAGFEMVVFNSDGTNRMFLGWGNQMTWYPDGNKIFFSYWQGAEIGIYDIKFYCFDFDENKRKEISEKYVGSHYFSPDGSHIAFSKSDSVSRIVILDYPGFSNPYFIGPSFSAGYPAWSPDNMEIAFSHTDTTDSNNEVPISNIYTTNIDGTNTRNISKHNSREHYSTPCWSPDGKRIIFLGDTIDGTQKCYLYMVNKDGTNLHRVIDDDTVTSCDWSK